MTVPMPYTQPDQQPNTYGTAVESSMGPSQNYVPESGNSEYVYPLGWATKLARRISGTPDPQREGDMPSPTVRPPNGGNPDAYYGPITAETSRRESVTETQAVGWNELKSQYIMGPDPRWNPPAESRLTSDMSPASYSFSRPFDQFEKGNGAREFNGVHFSLADHRRSYDVGGMAAAQNYRNTYRSSPAPWDADMYDEPAPQDLQSGVVNYVPAPSASSAYRL